VARNDERKTIIRQALIKTPHTPDVIYDAHDRESRGKSSGSRVKSPGWQREAWGAIFGNFEYGK